MPHLLWDASALTKRYAEEDGLDTVDELFKALPAPTMAGTLLGYTETYAALWRKRNRGAISVVSFREAASALRSEVLGGRFQLVTVYDTEVVSAVGYVQKYSLNASDAIILAAYLRCSAAPGEICVLIAADGRLLKAAAAEGLKTLNMELLPAADVASFLASL